MSTKKDMLQSMSGVNNIDSGVDGSGINVPNSSADLENADIDPDLKQTLLLAKRANQTIKEISFDINVINNIYNIFHTCLSYNNYTVILRYTSSFFSAVISLKQPDYCYYYLESLINRNEVQYLEEYFKIFNDEQKSIFIHAIKDYIRSKENWFVLFNKCSFLRSDRNLLKFALYNSYPLVVKRLRVNDYNITPILLDNDIKDWSSDRQMNVLTVIGLNYRNITKMNDLFSTLETTFDNIPAFITNYLEKHLPRFPCEELSNFIAKNQSSKSTKFKAFLDKIRERVVLNGNFDQIPKVKRTPTQVL